jgi:hypothetical protein
MVFLRYFHLRTEAPEMINTSTCQVAPLPPVGEVSSPDTGTKGTTACANVCDQSHDQLRCVTHSH